jgi:hypothetical protein
MVKTGGGMLAVCSDVLPVSQNCGSPAWLGGCGDAAWLITGEQVEQQPADERECASCFGLGGGARCVGLGLDEQVQPVPRRLGGEAEPGTGSVAQRLQERLIGQPPTPPSRPDST